MKVDEDLRFLAKGLNDECFSQNFKAVSRLISRYYSKCLKETGLLITQFSMMMLFAEVQGARVGNIEVAEALSMDRTTASRCIAVLLDNKFIEYGVKLKPDDVRPMLRRYVLTKKGIDILNTALPVWQKAQRAVMRLLAMRRRMLGLLKIL